MSNRTRLTDPKPNCLEIVYTWPDGHEEVRYRRSVNSTSALELINEVLDLQQRHKDACPYSYREVYQRGF